MVDSVRYYISYQSEVDDLPTARTFYPGIGIFGDSDPQSDNFTLAINSLTPDTEYTFQIRAEIRYSPCSWTTFVSGNYSDSVSFRTNATSELIISTMHI